MEKNYCLNALIICFIVSLSCFKTIAENRETTVFFTTGFEDVDSVKNGSFTSVNYYTSSDIKWTMINGDLSSRKTQISPISGKYHYLGKCLQNTTNVSELYSDYFSFEGDTVTSLSFKFTVTNTLNLNVIIETEDDKKEILYKNRKKADSIDFNIDTLSVTKPFRLHFKIYPSTKYQNEDRYSAIDDIKISGLSFIESVKKPDISSVKDIFTDKREVFLSQEEGRTIYYTLDGNDPDINSMIYDSPVILYESAILKAVSYSDDGIRSLISVRSFEKKTPVYTINEFLNASNTDKIHYSFDSLIVTSVTPELIFAENEEGAFIMKNNNPEISAGNILEGWFSGKFNSDKGVMIFTADDYIDVEISDSQVHVLPATYDIAELNSAFLSYPSFIKIENIIVQKNENNGNPYYYFIKDDEKLKIGKVIYSDFYDAPLPIYCDMICYPLTINGEKAFIIPDVNYITDKSDDVTVLFPPYFSLSEGSESNPTKAEYGTRVKIISSIPDVIFLDEKGNTIEDEFMITSSLQRIDVCAYKEGYAVSAYSSGWYSAYLSAPIISAPSDFDNNTNVKITSYPGALLMISTGNEVETMVSPAVVNITSDAILSCHAEIGDFISPVSTLSLKKIEKYVIGAFDNEDKYMAMSSEKYSTDGLKAYETEIDKNDEAIIKNKDLVWDSYRANIDTLEHLFSTKGFLKSEITSLSLSFASSSSNSTRWVWGAKISEPEYYVYNSKTSTRALRLSFTGGVFKNYTSGSNYSKSIKRYKVSQAIISGSATADEISGLCLNRFMKFADFSACTIDGSFSGFSPANPNCVFVVPDNLSSLPGANIISFDEEGNPVCDSLILTDNEPYYSPKDFYARRSSYSRYAYNDGGWESLIIPFSVREEDLPDDYIFEIFSSANDTEISFTGVRTIRANVPHIMRRKENFSDTQTLISFVNNDGCYIESYDDNDNEDLFRGTYIKRSAENDYILVMEDNESFFAIGSDKSYVCPFRATLKPVFSSAAGKVSLRHVENTTVNSVTTDENERLIIKKNTDESVIIVSPSTKEITVYDIMGKAVKRLKVNSGINNVILSKGVFIIEGHKVIL